MTLLSGLRSESRVPSKRSRQGRTWSRVARLGAWGAAVVLPVVAQAQNLIVTGRVESEFGQPLQFANVFIQELVISVATNEQGLYTVSVPAARLNGQTATLRVRMVGYVPQGVQITLNAGRQTHNFSLKKDINRLSEVVVTGSIEGTERAKVPFAVGRLTVEDIPVPSVDPLRAMQGKVAGLRIAQTSGQPGSAPQIMLRGPTSINNAGRSTGPMIIVDGTILRSGSLNEIGGLDIESVEVVKGAAGASLYGSTAANGVIIVKTKRGAGREGVKISARTEYGISDLNSFDWGLPTNHHLQLDETGKRFCVQGSGSVSGCSRTVNWMEEILRINNVNADTVRTPQSIQWNAPAVAGGELLNVYQAQLWPGQYYDAFAQVSRQNPITLNSIDVSGSVNQVRYYVSGSFTGERGAIKGLYGDEQRRARVNLDYDIRPNFSVSVSSMYDRGKTDLRSGGSSNGGIFGQLLRGAPAGTDYLARDTLGRRLVRGGGAGFRGTGNGAGTFLYDMETLRADRTSQRYLASISSMYTPADWATFEALFSYDNRARVDNSYNEKGYRTFAVNTAVNFGNQDIGNLNRETMNAQLSATFRKQFNSDLSGKATLRALYDSDINKLNNSGGQQFIVDDVFTLSNTAVNFFTGSSEATIKNMGAIAGANLEYKGRYILDGTFRYDGSSLFGSGNRWAPFGRVSAVWRISEEPFYKLPHVTDFRVRASRGTAGNTPRFEAQYETYACSAAGCSLGQAGNSLLKPETTTETEVGTDVTLFNRLGFEVTHARSSTKDQILNVPTPSSLGFTNQWQNAGTLANRTWEVAVNIPVVSKRDWQWNMRGTWDRTRTYITELFMPEYFTNAGTGQGTGSMFLITARKDVQDGVKVNRLGNIWGRKFYRTCGDLPAKVQSQCGDGQAYQVNDKGWVVWVGQGNTWRDGITKNLWQTKLPAGQSPWNYPLQFGHPIIDRPLAGERGEGIGSLHILGNTLPDFRIGWSSTLTYKRFTVYGLLDASVGHEIQNQGEGWGLLDFSSAHFDQANQTVETAKPLGYSWRVGGSEGAGTGGFYDILGPNNYNVETGSYGKIREFSATYNVGRLFGQGDWTFSLIGRNLFTFSKYSGYDPETGVNGGQAGTGLVNQVDAFGFPTLRSYTFSIGTRF